MLAGAGQESVILSNDNCRDGSRLGILVESISDLYWPGQILSNYGYDGWSEPRGEIIFIFLFKDNDLGRLPK